MSKCTITISPFIYKSTQVNVVTRKILVIQMPTVIIYYIYLYWDKNFKWNSLKVCNTLLISSRGGRMVIRKW